MKKKNTDIYIQFGNQLKRYIDHFGLIEADIAYLIGSNSRNIENIINGDKGLVLKTTERIANFFGLTYFEMGNPDFPIPQFKSLPIETQDAILKRKETGIQNRDYANDLAGNLDKILSTDFLNTPKTAEQIWAQLPEKVRIKVEPRRITDLLGKEPRKSMLEKLPPLPGTGKKNLFQLKKFVGK